MSRGQGSGGRVQGTWVLAFAGILGLAAGPRAGELAQGGVDTTVVIRASSTTLAFEPERISVKSGARVRIRFINQGTLPHNIVFVKDEADLDSLAAAAMRPTATGYVPLAMKDKMIAWSGLASPPDTMDLVFVVPAPGEYTYVCLMSGHANNMLGILRALR